MVDFTHSVSNNKHPIQMMRKSGVCGCHVKNFPTMNEKPPNQEKNKTKHKILVFKITYLFGVIIVATHSLIFALDDLFC